MLHGHDHHCSGNSRPLEPYKRFFFLLVLTILSLTATSEASDHWFEAKGDLGLRFDEQPQNQRKRLQNRIRLRTDLNLNDPISLRTMVSSGESYSSDWETIDDLTNENPPYQSPHLNVRQFFLQYKTQSWQTQFGAIPAIKKRPSATGLDQSGWIDGVRLETSVIESFVFEIVIGQLDSLSTPNFLDRNWGFNFTEIEINRNFSESTSLGLKYESFMNGSYFQVEADFLLKAHSNEFLKIDSDFLLREANSAKAYSILLSQDFFQAFFDSSQDTLNWELSYSHTDGEMGTRGQLNDDFYTFGTVLAFGLNGQIFTTPELRWFINYFESRQQRFNAGLQLHFKL